MKLKYIFFFLFINSIKSADYEFEKIVDSSINTGTIFYNTDYFYNYQYKNHDLKITYKFPERNFNNFYFIFDYNIERGQKYTNLYIKIFDKTFYQNRNKIALKMETTERFSLIIYFYSSSYYSFDFNFVFGYSGFPYFYYFANNNFSTYYYTIDDFRMFLDISEFKEKKDYYFYNSFIYQNNPSYKLFESFDSAENFDFKNFDGNLNVDDNKIIKFNKPNKKYKFVVLYFKGTNEYKSDLSKANFAILKNYEIYNFNPIIAIVIYVIIVIFVISLFYYLFQFEKKTKNNKEISRELIEKK